MGGEFYKIIFENMDSTLSIPEHGAFFSPQQQPQVRPVGIPLMGSAATKRPGALKLNSDSTTWILVLDWHGPRPWG